MPIYECDKCNKYFNSKGDYDRHINKKKSCIDDIKYECNKCHKKFDFNSEYLRHLNKKNQCNSEHITNNIDDNTDAYLLLEELNNALIKKDVNIIKCNECNKIFKEDRSLKRHMKYYCKALDIINKSDLIQTIYELKKELSNTKNNININNINGTINTGTMNNTTNNIIINAYGNEDLSHITDKEYTQLFNKCNSIIPTLIELIHFNDNKPENANVFISNIKSPHAYVYDGKKWILKNKNELIDDIYDNKCIIIIDKFDDMKEVLNKQTVENFNKFISKHDTDAMKENVTNKIELMLYNNRDIIKNK